MHHSLHGILSLVKDKLGDRYLCKYYRRFPTNKESNHSPIANSVCQLYIWWDLAFIKSRNLIVRIFGIPSDRYMKLSDRFVFLLDMGELLNLSVRDMSLKQNLRAKFAVALIHMLKVIYLGESTICLDQIVKEHIRYDVDVCCIMAA